MLADVAKMFVASRNGRFVARPLNTDIIIATFYSLCNQLHIIEHVASSPKRQRTGVTGCLYNLEI